MFRLSPNGVYGGLKRVSIQLDSFTISLPSEIILGPDNCLFSFHEHGTSKLLEILLHDGSLVTFFAVPVEVQVLVRAVVFWCTNV